MYTCEDCLKDPRVLSKDGTHRLCARTLGEVTIAECEEIRAMVNKEDPK